MIIDHSVSQGEGDTVYTGNQDIQKIGFDCFFWSEKSKDDGPGQKRYPQNDFKAFSRHG